jgi:hypothetical protein
MAGYFFTPFGIWNVDHGTPTLISLLLPSFQADQFLPNHQLGVQLYGSVYTTGWELGYHAYVANNRTPSQVDFDDGKTFGGRVFLSSTGSAVKTKIGASGYYGHFIDVARRIASVDPYVVATDETVRNRQWAVGADLSIDAGPLRIRTEGLVRRIETHRLRAWQAWLGRAERLLQQRVRARGVPASVGGPRAVRVLRGDSLPRPDRRHRAHSLGGLERSFQPQRPAQDAIRAGHVFRLVDDRREPDAERQQHPQHRSSPRGVVLMDRRTWLKATLASTVLVSYDKARASGGMVVIANKTGGIRALSGGDLESVFTTRKLFRGDGRPFVPFNFPPRHQTRVAFDRFALHLEPDEVARFWIDRRIRGGHPPPRQVPDASTMLRVVAALEDAIGYLPVDLVTDNVNVIAEL